jgi:N-acetylglucosamine-6-phosphate deacetylase
MAMRIQFPGLVDIQVNGFAGVDFNSPEVSVDSIRETIPALRATGVTRFLPTLITGPVDRFAGCARAINAVEDPAIAGIHMEGPYISPNDGPRGAHPRAHTLPASRDDFNRRQDAAGGRIVLVTLAPEVPGAIEMIEYLVDRDVRVAIGHSEAPPETIRTAIRAGATLSTHLGNGCAAMLPRHPNLIWEQLAADELLASVIVDGHHLPASTVKAAIRAKTPERTILTTDAMAAAGCPPGSYRIGDLDVEVGSDRRVSLRGTPYLAGSALTMVEAVANTVRFTGLSLEEVLPMASTVPARYAGIPLDGTVSAEWDPDRFTLEVIEMVMNPRGVHT